MTRRQAGIVLRDGRYHEIRALMHERFPAVFPERGSPGVPLAIGIRCGINRALFDISVSGQEIAAFLRIWTSRPEYLRQVALSEHRYGLDGRVAGPVANMHAFKAAIRYIGVKMRCDAQAHQVPA